MTPVSPVVPGKELPEVTFAANQPEYRPLPAYRDPYGTVLTRWRLSFWERVAVLFGGDVYLEQSTFNQPLQPVRLSVDPPEFEEDSHDNFSAGPTFNCA